MELTYPSFYTEFKCIADRCPDSCCHEWEVQVDEASAARFRAMDGPLGDDLRAVLYDEEGMTYLRNRDGRCPMWREDGLCRIQAERGHEALCQVCQQFPRLVHDYGDYVEQALEMSCPEAARLILANPDYATVSQTLPGGESPEYDELDMEILRATRSRAVEILLDRSLTVPQSLAVLLMYGAAAQGMLDAGEVEDFDPDAALEAAGAFARPGDVSELRDFFKDLEILTDRWQALLSQTPEAGDWQEADRAFARYLVERYWLQAVSDLDLVCRVKFAVISCLMVRSLPGPRTFTAQLYSKEIENNDGNVEAILDGAYTHRAFTDDRLLGLLLS